MVSKTCKGNGYKRKQGRSVTFAQRFGSALNLNLHFYSLVLDEVFNMKNAAV